MNDEPDKPLNPVGDQALEARIVAWVLGDASSFEAGELEKLCEKDPDLRLFERRMRVLHGLVAEDFKAGHDEEWRLSEGRRAKITDLLGVDPVPANEEIRREKSSRHFARRVLLAMAACVVITLISGSMIAIFGGVGESGPVYAMRPASAPAAMEEKGEASADQLATLRRAVIEQEDKVEDKRQQLSQVIRTEGIIYSGDQSLFHGGRGYDAADSAESAGRAYMELEKEKIQLESQIETLLKHEGDQFMAYAAGLNLPDNVLPGIVPKLQEAKQEYEALKSSGVGENHPHLAEKARELEELERDANEATSDLRESLKAKLELSKEQLARLKVGMDTRESDEVTKGIAGQSFADAKSDFESEQRVLEQLKIKLIEEEMRSGAGEDALAMSEVPAGPAPARSRKDSTLQPPVEAAPMELAENQSRFGRTAGEATAPPAPEQQSLGLAARGGEDSFAPASDMASLAAGGLRSGDGAITRDSIDAVLNSPDRAAAPQSDADISAPTDHFSDLQQMGEMAKRLDEGKSGQLDAGFRFKLDEPAPGRMGSEFGLADTRSSLGRNLNESNRSLSADEGTSLLADSATGGLRRDLGGDLDGAPAEGDARAKLREEMDKAWELAVPAEDPPATASAELAGPVQIDPAPTVERGEEVDEVRRNLHIGEGAYELGKYDDAHKAYEETLRIDPYNKAARRGMEKVAAARQDYYRAAYDQTRAKLLIEVDEAGGTSVPQPVEQERKQPAGEETPVVGGKLAELESLIDFVGPLPEQVEGYSTLAQKENLRRQNAVAESDQLRDEARVAYSAENYPMAYRKYVEALKVLPDADMVKGRRDSVRQSLQDTTVALASMAEKLGDKELSARWMEKGAEWVPKEEVVPVVEASAEISTAAEPFSTFSLHVSDASFKLAKAALERGEMPAAEGIRPEEFYNAFDYGDPAPAAGEPVVCAVEQAAHPALPQRNLLRIGVRTGSQGRGQSTPLNLTLLLDNSGSMEREDRQAGLAMAVRELSELLKEGDTISVVGFSRQPRLLMDRLPGARAEELNMLVSQTPSEGGTNLEEGLALGEALAKRQFDPAAQNRVVLFTDGAANLGDAEPETLQKRVEALRQQGIAFDAAGFGADGLNDRMLERLTRNGNGRYYIVDRPEDADANFAKRLAGAFRPAAENVKVQVRFNPARVAGYKLIGFEEHRLEKEDFRNDAVDAAELAAEEAGNALYQIEVLPQGEGEVGEVSVRFRDTASGRMVERTWTIPHEPQAAAFDLAAPSIQLAGLAAFTAEKLRGAPMADAIDFKQLSPVFSKVKAAYPASRPVADLGGMIENMK